MEKFDINEIINTDYGETAERYFMDLKEQLDHVKYETVCNLADQCYAVEELVHKCMEEKPTGKRFPN